MIYEVCLCLNLSVCGILLEITNTTQTRVAEDFPVGLLINHTFSCFINHLLKTQINIFLNIN